MEKTVLIAHAKSNLKGYSWTITALNGTLRIRRLNKYRYASCRSASILPSLERFEIPRCQKLNIIVAANTLEASATLQVIFYFWCRASKLDVTPVLHDPKRA